MPTGKTVPSDEALIGMLSAGLNMSQIAKRVGVSRERIRQIYTGRLSKEFGGLTGRQLCHKALLARRRTLSLETPPIDENARKVWDLCRSLGIEVSRIAVLPERNPPRYATHWLVISGRRCSIHCAREALPGGRGSCRRYFRAQAARWPEAEFTIMVVGGERILVIPQVAFESERFYVTERPGLSVYRYKAKADWWAYENAWHLLSRTA
jgi:hypothetical protein